MRRPALLDRMLGLRSDYQATFATPHGRRVLADLYHFTGVMQSGEMLQGDDLVKFHGARAYGLHVAHMLNQSEAQVIHRLEQGENDDGPESEQDRL